MTRRVSKETKLMRPSVIVLVIVGLLSGATAAVAQTETPTVLPTGTGEPPP